MRRIKWAAKQEQKSESDSDSDEDPQKKSELRSTEHCSLVWEGTLQKKFFDKWKVVEVKSEHEAIRALSDRGCEHYWNNVLSHKLE